MQTLAGVQERVIQTLTKGEQQPFSKSEEKQLAEALGYSLSELALVLELTMYIFEGLAFNKKNANEFLTEDIDPTI